MNQEMEESNLPLSSSSESLPSASSSASSSSSSTSLADSTLRTVCSLTGLQKTTMQKQLMLTLLIKVEWQMRKQTVRVGNLTNIAREWYLCGKRIRDKVVSATAVPTII